MPSVIMQAVVDYRGLFLDAHIGWPGKVHDARFFVNSSLYCKGMSGSLLPNWKRCISGVDVPLVILGDPAYPLLPWLMKPCPETAHSTTEEKTYNYQQSRARMLVEKAFGRLKGRWRCLLKRLDYQITNVPMLLLHVWFYTTCVKCSEIIALMSGYTTSTQQQHKPAVSLPVSVEPVPLSFVISML